MSRPTVGIDRLTPRRATIEPREAMNCKSCRKRKIKCNRLRPSCEACKVFQCPCVYDAVPKKRGPKTDVLEALLKRVDGLEKRLQDEQSPVSPTSPDKKADDPPKCPANSRRNTIDASFHPFPAGNARLIAAPSRSQTLEPFPRPTGQGSSRNPSQPSPNGALSETLLNAYFGRLHGKPFFILDESTTRQRYQMDQLPAPLCMAISAMAVRYTQIGPQAEQSMRAGLDSALQARRIVDLDNPTIEGLQSLLLLSQAFFAFGLGKKAYMTFCPGQSQSTAPEREMRRRLFWTVYLMDRFITCGSRRPCLISDHSIVLRLPSWSPNAAGLIVEGELFHVGPNIQYCADSRRKSPSAASLLIDITRILGATNRYLAAGGVKGDSHFPWHALSNLSKIRQELDIWAAGTQDIFASIEALFGHPESTTLLLSKLIYHLVHCLLYRPFLPIDLVELRGTGQHQSWQIEATNLCFSHSNAIAELVELGRNSPLIEWPAFVGYCVCTAGTVHVHGVHYKGNEGDVFSSSSEFLSREMHQLAWLRNVWTGVRHQRELLQTISTFHAELVRTVASSPMRFSPVFHLEDFLDRYPGLAVDGAHVRLVDAGDDMFPSPTNYVERQKHVNQGPMTPSYPTPRIYSNTRPVPSPFPPAQSPESERRSSHPQSLANKHLSYPAPPSPALQFHQPPNNPSQPSPSFSTIFPVRSATDLSTQPGASAENNHLCLPSAFSPSAFGLSPPAFLTDPSLNIAPTPPSHPQYATFPFDTTNGNVHEATQPGGTAALTPGAHSQTSGPHTAGSESGSLEKDPFLSLLEHLAENENSHGGPSELDFFLTDAIEQETALVSEDKAGASGI
ncbi:hypothetical protein N7512_004946 [Penicillium capsulatum]|nr:hypothetical protein N7512_004946 [Penicillium capsulatum]